MLMRPLESHRRVSSSRGHRHRCGYRGPSADHTAKRILRAFVARGLLENCDAKDMLGYKHSGFSVDAGCASKSRPRCAGAAAALLRASTVFHGAPTQRGSKLVYRCAKQRSEPTSDKRGAKADELHLTPLELIDRIAALVPPPRTHRHRYFGVGTKLAAESGGNGAGSACCVATSHGGDCTTWRGVPGVAAPGNAATPTNLKHARSERRITWGGADCPHLRGISAAVPHVRWADAHHCLHHPQRRNPPS